MFIFVIKSLFIQFSIYLYYRLAHKFSLIVIEIVSVFDVELIHPLGLIESQYYWLVVIHSQRCVMSTLQAYHVASCSVE